MPSEKKQPERRNDSGKSEMSQRFKSRPFVFIGTIFILVIVVIAFVFVPAIPTDGGGMGDFTFGHYNRVPIRLAPGNFFHQTQDSLMRQNQHLFAGGPVEDLTPWEAFNNTRLRHEIWRGAFEETVVFMGIQDEMGRAGLVVPDHVVDREVARQFQVGGRFDAASYRAMDNATRMSMWRQTQERIAVGRYFSDLGRLRVSSGEAAFIGSMASPRRTLSVAIFPLDSYPDYEVALHAQANPLPFRATHLSRITAFSEWEAQQILDSVRGGEIPFEEAARLNSIDFFAHMGGDMGIQMAFELAHQIWDADERERVINLAAGDLSDIVRVSMPDGTEGWVFFRAEEAFQAADVSDPAQLGRIRAHIMGNLRGTVENWVIAEAESFAAQVRERGFETVGAEGNILRRNFGPIPANFGDSILFTAV
ncbi:MAG: peptidylprolyl isomerase, partial [Treponema sp.]|nr:peptidylprolyl isomerase [Treponema sp.]